MSLFKYFRQDKPAPTSKEMAEAASFKQILKYGNDIGGMYKDVSIRLDAIFKEKREIKQICEKAIIKQRNLKFKEDGIWRNNWNTLYLREYSKCNKSPLDICVTMMEYGSDNPEKDDPQNCFYCDKEYKK